MATTALVTEILIVGLEAEAWIALLVLTMFGTDWVDLEALDGWEALVTILALAVAYVLGIIVDRLADSVLGRVQRPKRAGGQRVPFARKRLEVLHRSPGMAPFLEYQRSRLRVARGTVFNVVPATGIAAALVLWRVDVADWWTLAVLAAGGVAASITLVAANRIAEAYQNRLNEAYSIVAGHST